MNVAVPGESGNKYNFEVHCEWFARPELLPAGGGVYIVTRRLENPDRTENHVPVFSRAQLAFYLQMSRWQALRFVRSLVTKGFAAEDTLEDQKVCRIFRRRVYQTLGTEDIRHRPVSSREILLRRLLSLDYVLEHPGLPWLPTESEKVAAFKALGIERRHLPLRVYRGAVGETRHYFRLKLPIAVEPDRAVFVYADPGYGTATALRSWGAGHRRLWKALRKRDRKVEVVAVAREIETLVRAERVLGRWAGNFGRGGSVDDPLAGREIARIEQAILKGNVRVLEEYGDLQGALKRIVELKKIARKRSSKMIIEGFSTWWSRRVTKGGF